MSLRSTIHQITARDDDLQSIGDDLHAFLQVWRNDLVALYDIVRNQLGPLEAEGLISFGYVTFNVEEEGLGKYSAPGLVVKVANRSIFLAPQARLTSGGAGRVDMYKGGNPSSDDRVWIVRRILENGTAAWFIEKKEAKKKMISGLMMHLLPLEPANKEYLQLHAGALEMALDYLLSN